MASSGWVRRSKRWPLIWPPRSGHSYDEGPAPPAAQCTGSDQVQDHLSHLLPRSRSIAKKPRQINSYFKKYTLNEKIWGRYCCCQTSLSQTGNFFQNLSIGDIKGNIHCTCTCTSYIKNVQLLYKFIVLLMVLFGDFKV